MVRLDAYAVVLALLGAGTLLTGCGDAATDKAGGQAGAGVRVLRLANANNDPYELEAFAREVRSVSNGRLRIGFVNNWGPSTRDAEPGILDDVRAGKVDLAWVGARAFRAAGVTAFDPVIAPFAVTDYETEGRVLTGPIGQRMLDGADGAGVRVVALLPGPLRLLAVDDSWSGAADLARKRINVSAGVGEATVRAFGAIPFVSGADTSGDTFNATEANLRSLLGHRYVRTMPHVAVEPLWPRPLVVIADPQLWDELPAADRKALTDAGRKAVGPTLDDIRAVDEKAIPDLCEQGAQFFHADIADLRRAVAPVYAEIRRDAEDARNLAAIERLRGPAAAKIVCKAPVRRVAGGPPPGEYTWRITLADAKKVPGGATSVLEKEVPDDFRAVIERGHVVLYVSVRGAPEEVGFESTYSVYKDRIDFGDGKVTARWRVVNGDLVFSDVRGEGPADVVVFASHPWKRVR